MANILSSMVNALLVVSGAATKRRSNSAQLAPPAPLRTIDASASADADATAAATAAAAAAAAATAAAAAAAAAKQSTYKSMESVVSDMLDHQWAWIKRRVSDAEQCEAMLLAMWEDLHVPRVSPDIRDAIDAWYGGGDSVAIMTQTTKRAMPEVVDVLRKTLEQHAAFTWETHRGSHYTSSARAVIDKYAHKDTHSARDVFIVDIAALQAATFEDVEYAVVREAPRIAAAQWPE